MWTKESNSIEINYVDYVLDYSGLKSIIQVLFPWHCELCECLLHKPLPQKHSSSETPGWPDPCLPVLTGQIYFPVKTSRKMEDVAFSWPDCFSCASGLLYLNKQNWNIKQPPAKVYVCWRALAHLHSQCQRLLKEFSPSPLGKDGTETWAKKCILIYIFF